MDDTDHAEVYKVVYTVDAPPDVAWMATTGVPTWLVQNKAISDVMPVRGREGEHTERYHLTWKDGSAQVVHVQRDLAKRQVEMSFSSDSMGLGSLATSSIVMRPFLEYSTLVQAEIRVTNSFGRRLAGLIVIPVGTIDAIVRSSQLDQFWRTMAKHHRKASADILRRRRSATGRTHIIAIGVGQSSVSEHWEKLRFASSDAEVFYDRAQRAYPNEDPTDATLMRELLLGESATSQHLGEVLTRIANGEGYVQSGDRIIFYFSGHIDLEQDNLDDTVRRHAYLVTTNAQPGNLRWSSFKRDDARNLLERTEATEVFFICDACYSGGRRVRSVDELRRVRTKGRVPPRPEFSRGEKMAIIAAAGRFGEAAESDLLKHGVLTYALLQGLSGKANGNGDGCITLSELDGFLKHEVDKQSKGLQTPYIEYPGSMAESLAWPVQE